MSDTKSFVEQALDTLALPEYAELRSIFGPVLEKRAKQRDPDCFLFRLLQRRQTHELRILNHDCAVYIRELGLQEAQRKCKREIGGTVGRPAHEFNMRCGDFWTEMAAVRVLARNGFHNFRTIKTKSGEGDHGTNDYRCDWGKAAAYAEVKNLHANDTVYDVFVREIGRAHEPDPSGYSFHLAINYPFDYLPTGEQERRIRDFITSIRGRTPPFRETLDLEKATAAIDVTAGEGTAHLYRGVGGECPEPIDYDWLLAKVRNKAEEARVQIPDGDHIKVVVINVDSTTAMLSFDFIRRAKQEIRDVLGADVRAYVLMFRNHARIDDESPEDEVQH